MFTVEELLSKKNQKFAFAYLSKKDGCGIDGFRVSDLPDYWKANGERICTEIRECKYKPGTVLMRERINNKGKRRVTCSLTALDRLITRLMTQKLERYVSPVFFDNSFAYQKDKGCLEAAEKGRQYMEDGNCVVCEIDIKDFFDTISLERMERIISTLFTDKAVLHLFHEYLHCLVSKDGRMEEKKVGLLQGSPISPILSNLYMQDLDSYMEKKGYLWLRYADNIYVFAELQESATIIYNDLIGFIRTDLNLNVNETKSGIFNAVGRRILGYDLIKKGKKIDIQKHQYKEQKSYTNWHDARIETRNGLYHIVSEGVINKQDYGLLFENTEKKCFIPVEVTDQINLYSSTTIAPNVLQILSSRGIKMCFFDRNGNLVGTYYPRKTKETVSVLVQQVKNLGNEKERRNLAESMEVASLHNIRSNLKYYAKQNETLKDVVSEETDYIEQIRKAKTVEEMMLIEAKARQLYYRAFNNIITDDNFKFVQRSKQPPKDEINACISFGNTLLYNHFASLCWKRGISPKFGVIHYSERREQSLNFDFADIFKPVVTDRIIFSLINKKMINKLTCFEKRDNGGVYLSAEGKRIFIEAFEDKLNQKIKTKECVVSYRTLMDHEVQNYKKYLQHECKYKPYKYY